MSDEQRHVILHLLSSGQLSAFFALSNTEMSCIIFYYIFCTDILPLAKEASASV